MTTQATTISADQPACDGKATAYRFTHLDGQRRDDGSGLVVSGEIIRALLAIDHRTICAACGNNDTAKLFRGDLYRRAIAANGLTLPADNGHTGGSLHNIAACAIGLAAVEACCKTEATTIAPGWCLHHAARLIAID